MPPKALSPIVDALGIFRGQTRTISSTRTLLQSPLPRNDPEKYECHLGIGHLTARSRFKHDATKGSHCSQSPPKQATPDTATTLFSKVREATYSGGQQNKWQPAPASQKTTSPIQTEAAASGSLSTDWRQFSKPALSMRRIGFAPQLRPAGVKGDTKPAYLFPSFLGYFHTSARQQSHAAELAGEAWADMFKDPHQWQDRHYPWYPHFYEHWTPPILEATAVSESTKKTIAEEKERVEEEYRRRQTETEAHYAQFGGMTFTPADGPFKLHRVYASRRYEQKLEKRMTDLGPKLSAQMVVDAAIYMAAPSTTATLRILAKKQELTIAEENFLDHWKWSLGLREKANRYFYEEIAKIGPFFIWTASDPEHYISDCRLREVSYDYDCARDHWKWIAYKTNMRTKEWMATISDIQRRHRREKSDAWWHSFEEKLNYPFSVPGASFILVYCGLFFAFIYYVEDPTSGWCYQAQLLKWEEQDRKKEEQERKKAG